MQIQSKQKQTSLGGRFQTFKNDIFAQASTYLRIAVGDGLFFLGLVPKYWGGPGPPWPPPRDPPGANYNSTVLGLGFAAVQSFSYHSVQLSRDSFIARDRNFMGVKMSHYYCCVFQTQTLASFLTKNLMI